MRSKTAIVAEGGGQRGIYTAGVLDAFLGNSYNPFDLGVGVSAGAQNLLAYFLEQSGYARRMIVERTNRPDFLVPYRWLIARSILDLDGYFEASVQDPDYLLPYHNITSMAKIRRLQFVATDSLTLGPVYLEPDAQSACESLKASSAVPFLYREGVSIDSRVLVDGGVSDPLPVRHAYLNGARNIVLLRTSPVSDSDEAETPWRRYVELARRVLIKPSLMNRMLESHEQALQSALDFIDTPPDDLRLFVIAPVAILKSQVFASQTEYLFEDYRQGVSHGQRAVNSLKKWLKEDTAALP